jgi:hypothetical protein
LAVGPLELDACDGSCGGIWFDNFELQKVQQAPPADFDLLLSVQRDEGALVDHERRRCCPRCSDIVMMRHFFSSRRETEVDTCPNCGGVWLDAGELQMIRREIANQQQRQAAVEDYLRDVFNQGFIPRRSRPNE